MGLTYAQLLPSSLEPWTVVGPPDATTVALHADLTVNYAGGSTDTIPAGTVSSSVDRSTDVWVVYTVPASLTLSLAKESLLSGLSGDWCPLARLVFEAIQPYQPVTPSSGGGPAADTPAALARTGSSTIVITNNTATDISFASTDYDQGTTTPQWASGAPTVLECQNAGLYLVTGHVAYGSGTYSGLFATRLLQNGNLGTGTLIEEQAITVDVTSNSVAFSVAGQAKLAVGDLVKLQVQQLTGVSRSIFSNPSLDYTTAWLSMVRIGGNVSTEAALSFLMSGGDTAIGTGYQGSLVVPYPCTIQSVTLLADAATSTVLDIQQDTYSTYPSSTSIVASAPPTLSTAQKSQDSTLTGWTTALAAGDILRFSVSSNDVAVELSVVLLVSRA